MTEEYLVLGRPPRPPRPRRWGKRGPRIALATVLVMLVGWALWQGLLDDPSSTPRGAAKTPTPTPTAEVSDYIVHEPPAIPYLRSGTLIEPDAAPRGLPDGSWTNFVVLVDGRVVLAQEKSVSVIGPGRQRRTYELTGGLSARPDSTAVAWTGRDGQVRRLRTGHVEPEVLPGTVQLVPTCRGLRDGGRLSEGWESCDQDGNLLSPDKQYFAQVGSVSVTISPRADITSGIPIAFLGTILDATWEDSFHLLVVMGIADEAHLLRIGIGGKTEDLVTLHGAEDRTRPALVLPAVGGPSAMALNVQP